MTGESPQARIEALQAQLDRLRDRMLRMSRASLDINESLELDNVLRVVIDNARDLTGADIGGIVILDEAEEVRRFVSSGLTPQEHRVVSETPGGSEYFEHVVGLSEPLRVPDLAAYFGSLGLPEFHHPLAANSYLAAPIRTRGEAVGCIFLSKGPPGPEFDEEDAATLAMFASQAALVITNARRYREEQRARADLETLIDTSSVGVAVLCARTGSLIKVNREMMRIAGELSRPGQPDERLLGTITLRRADGRELSLAEHPLALSLASGETVRAEKIFLIGPEGGSISVLANATPIYSENGAVESFVVTLQDMTPLEELERLRADLLGLVSEELRAPLVAVKGSAATLLESLSTLDPAETTQLVRIIAAQADRMRDLIGELVDVARIETGTLPITVEPTEVDRLIDRAVEAFLDANEYKRVTVDVASGLPLVMADRRRIMYVIDTLAAAASRLSNGSAPLRIVVRRQHGYVQMAVIDPSCGPSTESLAPLFDRTSLARRGTSANGTDSSGAGFGFELGLAVCKGIIEAHGGRIWAETDRDASETRYAFTLPLARPSARIPATRRHQARPRDQTARIAVIEDDPLTQRYIHDTLTKAGYGVTVAVDVERALSESTQDPFDLVLASLTVGAAGGVDPLTALRSRFDGPVIVLAAYGQHEAIVNAINTAAADYIVKPFSPTELAARVAAVLHQRTTPDPAQPGEPFTVGELIIDYSARTVTVAGRSVALSRTDFQLLRELSQNAGRVLSHDELMHRVWRSTSSPDPGMLRSAIKRLRRKLGDSATEPAYIVTVPGVGYRIANPAN